MTIEDALRGSAIARNEAELLLALVLGTDRTAVIAHPEKELEAEQAHHITELFTRRRKGEPMGYLLGSVEFFGRMFHADSRALIPRSPTESLVEMALASLVTQKEETRVIDTGIVGWSHPLRDPGIGITTVVDCGTGAGCIAVSLGLENPELRVIATDVSKEAIALAKENAEHLEAGIEFRIGDALEPIADLAEPFLLVSNPPYIPSDRSISKEVSGFEPHVALFGGEQGMEVTRRILTQVKSHPHCTGWIIECEQAQKELLAKEFC